MLYAKSVDINDSIKIVVPTVGEVLENEEKYYALSMGIVATPSDMMVQLDDVGIDFTKITGYEMFLMMAGTLFSQDTSLVFGDIDMSGYEPSVNPVNGMVVLRNPKTGSVIDRLVYDQICGVLRDIHHIKENHKKPGNEDARKYLIDRARKKMRRKKKESSSQLEGLIVAMVNTEQFKYNFETVRDMTIYQFNESVKQIIKKVDFDNRMYGVYAGTVDVNGLSQDDLNWLTNK